jgi:hypothetical protein
MSKINMEINELRSEINNLKEKYPHEYAHRSSIVLALSIYLDEIDNYLLEERLAQSKLDEYSFGLFRQVTDDYQLEQSSFGQHLLNISNKLRDLGKNL